jgi:hypothetical protein
MPAKRPERLPRRWHAAIIALLSEATISAAAAKVSINEKTLRRWLSNPRFEAAYAEERRRVFEAAGNLLQSAELEAVTTLRACLSSQSDHAKIRASLGIIEGARQAYETQTLTTRIAALEAKMRSREE